MFKLAFQLFAFLMELAMLAGIGYWGFQQGKSTFTKYGFTILLVGVAIVIWGIWMAPTSKYRLEMHYRIFAESLLFLITAFMIYKSDLPMLACVFTVCVLIRESGAFLLKE